MTYLRALAFGGGVCLVGFIAICIRVAVEVVLTRRELRRIPAPPAVESGVPRQPVVRPARAGAGGDDLDPLWREFHNTPTNRGEPT